MMDELSVGDKRFRERLVEVLAMHFDPKWGAAYWLERSKRFDFDPRRDVADIDGLWQFGLTAPDELRSRPLADWVPRSLHSELPRMLVAETGGTSGAPVRTVYSTDEFREAFVDPFIAAAEHVGFPRGGAWLHAGPDGPHIIGRAAAALTRAMDAVGPFTVDFDARWAKKIQAGSFAAQRYLAHVAEQSLAILDREPVTVLFSTPVVLDHLARRMSEARRDRIRGVHYGGMVVERALLDRLQTEGFRNAVHLAGFGNTLFGCGLELDVAPGRSLRYFPRGARLLFGLVQQASGGVDRPRYAPSIDAGRLVFTRLDHSVLLINVVERDRGRIIVPPPDHPDEFLLPGVESPEPWSTGEAPVMGLY